MMIVNMPLIKLFCLLVLDLSFDASFLMPELELCKPGFALQGGSLLISADKGTAGRSQAGEERLVSSYLFSGSFLFAPHSYGCHLTNASSSQ